MISHSAITAVFVLLAWAVSWLFATDVTLTLAFNAAFLTGLWFSREQYWEELKMRRGTKPLIAYLPLSILLVFRPMYRNTDFFVPVALAWLAVTATVWGPDLL